jgi:hypothetical protein
VRSASYFNPSMGRQRFVFNLSALGVAIMLVLAAAAFGPHAAKWVGLGIGIAGCVTSSLFVALLVHERRFSGRVEFRFRGRRIDVFSLLGGTMASIAVWEIVAAAVFQPRISRWLTLADGLVIAALACAGLVLHEVSRERVVHVLEVVERPRSTS